MRWGYRVAQLLARLNAHNGPLTDDAVRSILPGAAVRLYQDMSPTDRAHAQKVLLALRQLGQFSPDVQQAALLHDVGKARARLSLAHRALFVLLEWFDKRLLERLADSDSQSWRFPFYVQLHHGEIGAALCAEAGCSPLTVALVRYHELPAVDLLDRPELREGLLALKKADDRS